jgi:hypothetical protein
MKKTSYTLQEKQAVLRDSLRRMEPVHMHWRMLEALYRTGAQRELTMLDLNRILPFPVPGSFLRTVNMVLPHVSMMINTIVSRDPKFVVIPTDGDPDVVEKNARIAKNVLEYFWQRTDATQSLRDATQDMVILGNGFLKTGWSYSETTVDKTPDMQNIEVQDLISAAQDVALETGVPLTEQTMTEIVESVSMTQQLVETDEPYVEYVSPYDMFLPATARRINNARWVAQRIRIPIEELKENKLFDKEAVDNLKSDTGYTDPTTQMMYENTEEGLPPVFTQATIFEFYDMKSKTVSIFQLDAEKALYEGPIPYEHRFSPYVHLRNFSDGGSTIWAFGDMENIAGVQLMINEIMHSELNDLKRVGNKYFINKNVYTPEIGKALQDNRPDLVIPVDLPNNMTMNEVLQPVQRLGTPSDNYVMERKLQDYMQSILGITDFQMGNVAAASRVSGTASAAIEGASTTRALDKLQNVEKASEEVGLRILALCQQFLDNQKAIRIAGADAPLWLQVTESDIKGEFSIDVESGSTSAINPASRYRQGMELLQLIVPSLVQLGYNPEPTIRTALSYMGLNPDNILVPAPTPQLPPMPEQTTGQTPQEQVNPEINNQNLQNLLNLGGTPMPGITEGGTL